MTSATGPGLPADDLLRRLRAWPAASWGHGERIARTRVALRELADLAGQARGHPAPPVPELAVTALADQLAVLLADASRAGAAPVEIGRVLNDLGRHLGLG